MSTRASKPSLLIVDDDPLITDAISYFLRSDYAITTSSSRPETIEHLRAGYAPDLALIDLGLPPRPHRPEEGYQLISDLLAHCPAARIIVLSGQHDESNARHARTLGAVDFVAKPADPEQLRQLLQRVLALPQTQSAGDTNGTLIGASPAMESLRARVAQYADSPFPVLIAGESGSGKELVARELHKRSARRSRPMLTLNCAAISPSLVEPTLFGHTRGAFTGALQTKTGYFEDADDGTLFLDEIGELPLDLQPKLLRVLENGEFQRVGDTQARTSKARIIAATNRDLRLEVREGRFRADLYHRLSVFTVHVPALRDMESDRSLLLGHFARFYAQETGLPPFTLDPTAQAMWASYPFPGNVRELRNIVIRLCTKHPGVVISAAQLAEELDASVDRPSAGASQAFPSTPMDNLLAIAKAELKEADEFHLDQVLQAWERAYIQAAQELTAGNMSQTAKMLGINRTTLYNRIVTLERGKR